jgi:RING finger protein 113A
LHTYFLFKLCVAGGAGTDGVFNSAKNLWGLLDKKREREWRNKAAAEDDEEDDDESKDQVLAAQQ